MSELSGMLFVGGNAVAGEGVSLRGVNPATATNLEPEYREATVGQVADAVVAAEAAFRIYSRFPAKKRAEFLRAIADELQNCGMLLLERANLETGLPIIRLESERLRTTNQLRLMADVIEEGSWVEARIDTGDASRQPLPKPDLRRMLVPLGPVAVFSASNFPFAYAIAGGDVATAFAAGCTVVCKGHPAHPGTSEMSAAALYRAAVRTGIPAGVFSLVQGWAHEVGTALVTHPLIRAVGFTGSLRGGRAIFDAAAKRAEPIPVYAEMGSVNPIFLLPSAVKQRTDAIVAGLANSMTQGVGQFCTSPGVILGIESESFSQLLNALEEKLQNTEPGVMLYDGLFRNWRAAVDRATNSGATVVAKAASTDLPTRAQQTLLATDVSTFLSHDDLRSEMFGPAAVVVTGKSMADLERVADALEGQLTATIFGTDEELAEHANLVFLLQRKVGRLIFNGYPTGLEVGHAIVHGGPYPASTDSRTTAVGSAAISRFARPVCFQNFPEAALASELRNENTNDMWRMINGTPSKVDIE